MKNPNLSTKEWQYFLVLKELLDELSKKEKNVIFGGRLAEYKYYDMHQVIGSAMNKAKKVFDEK